MEERYFLLTKENVIGGIGVIPASLAQTGERYDLDVLKKRGFSKVGEISGVDYSHFKNSGDMKGMMEMVPLGRLSIFEAMLRWGLSIRLDSKNFPLPSLNSIERHSFYSKAINYPIFEGDIYMVTAILDHKDDLKFWNSDSPIRTQAFVTSPEDGELELIGNSLQLSNLPMRRTKLTNRILLGSQYPNSDFAEEKNFPNL